jgi:hypothetical protein
MRRLAVAALFLGCLLSVPAADAGPLVPAKGWGTPANLKLYWPRCFITRYQPVQHSALDGDGNLVTWWVYEPIWFCW